MANDLLVFIRRAWRNANRRISRAYLDLAASRTDQKLEKLGSQAHGWYAPPDLPQGARCYCIGVGLDASFDFALAERGAEVHAFDPTPTAIAYMERENAAGTVTFHPWGVLDRDTTMRLHYPMNADHGSYFIHDLHGTGKFHEVPCHRMSTIMKKLGHREVYLVKMDIEGSWYEAVPDMLASGIRPLYVQIEFDSPAPVWRVAPVLRALSANGYRMALRAGDNTVFKRTGG